LVILGTLAGAAIVLFRLESACHANKTAALLRCGMVGGVFSLASVWLLANDWPADLTLVCATSAAMLAFGVTSFWQPS